METVSSKSLKQGKKIPMSAEEFRARLLEEGETERLAVFDEGYAKLKDWAEQVIYTLTAVSYYEGIPTNDGSAAWVAYVTTGDIEKWNKVRKGAA